MFDRLFNLFSRNNIPDPKSGKGSRGKNKYGFSEMKVNDSLSFSAESSNNKYVNSAKQHGRRNNKKFTSRFDKQNLIITIWRIK
jgi:hypothetical protein